MIQVEIPNNVSEYKPKFIAGLTGKQVALAVFAAFAIFLDFKFIKPYTGELIALFIAIIPAFIAAAFGWAEPYGMPFDKYLKSVLINSLIAPKTRKARSTSSFVVPCDKNYVPIPDSQLSPEVLEHVNYIREKCGIEVPEETNTKKRFKREKKPKYKKSVSAFM